MNDKDVGKLWRYWTDPHKFGLSIRTVQEMRELILKLVDERARNKRLQVQLEDTGAYLPSKNPIDRTVNEELQARRDFGIAEED